MGILNSIFGRKPKVDKTALIKALAMKRASKDPEMSGLGFEDDILRLNRIKVLGLPEAKIVGIVETYTRLKKEGADSLTIIEMIEDHRSNIALGGTPGGIMPEPLTLRSYIKYRVALETQGLRPVDEEFIDYAMDAAWEAYTQT